MTNRLWMKHHIACATLILGATLAATTAPASAADGGSVATTTAEPACPASPAEPKKKRKGLGLGGILGAAQQVGVGRFLGGGMGGAGGKGQIAGAVLGTAIEVAGNTSKTDAGPHAKDASNQVAQAEGGCPAARTQPAPGN